MTQERAGAVDFTVPFMDSQLVIMAKEVNRKVVFLFKCGLMYRTRAIISRGLYTFCPIFHCGLYCRAVSITDNLRTVKLGDKELFGNLKTVP